MPEASPSGQPNTLAYTLSKLLYAEVRYCLILLSVVLRTHANIYFVHTEVLCHEHIARKFFSTHKAHCAQAYQSSALLSKGTIVCFV